MTTLYFCDNARDIKNIFEDDLPDPLHPGAGTSVIEIITKYRYM
jgi:hypothetical protein